ncbi:MAG: hypothetical protein A2381_15880 [Bdellovibrionales bacterium RIFOXYB1_FULL_37_110]|nr:MAG: hypothetical protein A2417_07730 [Bdellovibrionales bacterium RIFOXYC1_FULL_37_79]OFZ57093.1 MAG: hypothetical protein A2381_15880 [Bdellovibrionales bacterium RIFOXYB1_FULL_37_110]OFZ62056.1 MAG: hypothetical protein A2577_08350 [Bdellovibrionales bacterium RIFOXYD1_FULL_36_51]
MVDRNYIGYKLIKPTIILWLFIILSNSLLASTCYNLMDVFLKKTERNLKPAVQPEIVPQFGPVIHEITANGSLDMTLALYLPPTFGSEVQLRNPNSILPFFKAWIPMQFDPSNNKWSHRMLIGPNRSYYFRYKDINGKWVEVSDPNAFTYSKRPYQLKRTKNNLTLFDNYPFENYSLRMMNIRKADDFDINFIIYLKDIVPMIDADLNQTIVEMKIFDRPNSSWEKMLFDQENKKWSNLIKKIRPNTPYIYRISSDKGKSWRYFVDPHPVKTIEYNAKVATELPSKFLIDHDVPVTPALKDMPNEITLFDFRSLTPDLDYQWKTAPPKLLDQPLIIGDIPLPAILPNFKQGQFAAKETRDLIDVSLARRIIDSGVLVQLKEEGINSLQAVIQINVSDFASPNWKFTYLVAGQAIDIQLGSWREVKELVDEMRLMGMELIPDIVVAHEVKNSSVIGKQVIKDRHNNYLYYHSTPYLFRDYSTFMQNLENPNIRGQLIDNVLRLAKELRLRAIRLDFIDGILAQYEGKTFFNPLIRQNFIENIYGKEHLPQLNLDHINGFLKYFDITKLAHPQGIDEFVNTLIELGKNSHRPVNQETILAVLDSIKDNFDKNYGAVFIEELVTAIDHYCPNLVVISEAFSKAHTPQAQAIGKITYQPWVGYSSVDEKSIGEIVHALNHATGSNTRLGVGMAASHDNVEKGAQYLSGRSLDGKHLGQLALDESKALLDTGRLSPLKLADFITWKIATHELTALFGSDAAYMTTLHHLRFKTADDLHNFEMVFQLADLKKEIEQLVELTGLDRNVISSKIERYINFMKQMRKLYLETTTLQTSPPRNIYPNIEIKASQLGEHAIAIFRTDKSNPQNKLLILINRSLDPVENSQLTIPPELTNTIKSGSQWKKIQELVEGGTPEQIIMENNGTNLTMDGLNIAVFRYEE